MKRIIALIFITFIYFNSFSQKINDKVKELDESDASSKIENYYNELNNFSDDSIYKTVNQRKLRINDIIRIFFLNENVIVKNDLDTSNNTENSYKISEYLGNIKVFLADYKTIHFEVKVNSVNTYYKEEKDSIYNFIKAETTRFLVLTDKNDKVKKDSMGLDFYFLKKGYEVYIASITKHRDESKELNKVIIDNKMPSPVTGQIYMKTDPSNVNIDIMGYAFYSLKTPAVLPFKKAGYYNMTLSSKGYEGLITNITIRDGKTDTIKYMLIKATGFFVFNIKPKNAEIYIDTEKINYKNNIKYEEIKGKHIIAIKSNHYYSKTLEKTLKIGKEIIITDSLKPKLGHLNIINDNEYALNATVYIDSIKAGQIPISNIALIEGVHKLIMEKDNCHFTRKVNVSENETTDVKIKIDRERNITFTTVPSDALVFIDDTINAIKSKTDVNVGIGTHKIKIRRMYYNDVDTTINFTCDSDDKIELLSNLTKKKYTYIFKSEDDYLKTRPNVFINKKLSVKTPDTISLTYGQYRLKIKDNEGRYSSNIFVPLNKAPNVYPIYPLSSMNLLNGSFNLNENNSNEGVQKNYQASFLKYGFYGLSFSLVGAYPFTINNKYYTPLSIILTDPEFKAGGSLYRKIDICVVGQAIYAKNPENAIKGFKSTDGDLLTYFEGAEFRTRFKRNSPADFFIRFGFNHDYLNFKINGLNSFLKPTSNVNYGNFICSFGITLFSFGNNDLLRLWYKPIFN